MKRKVISIFIMVIVIMTLLGRICYADAIPIGEHQRIIEQDDNTIVYIIIGVTLVIAGLTIVILESCKNKKDEQKEKEDEE